MKSFIDFYVRFNNSLFFTYTHVYKSAMMMIEDNPNLFQHYSHESILLASMLIWEWKEKVSKIIQNVFAMLSSQFPISFYCLHSLRLQHSTELISMMEKILVCIGFSLNKNEKERSLFKISVTKFHLSSFFDFLPSVFL